MRMWILKRGNPWVGHFCEVFERCVEVIFHVGVGIVWILSMMAARKIMTRTTLFYVSRRINL